MYTAQVSLTGLSPILQHSFGAASLEGVMEKSKKRAGTTDYSLEWMDTMYATADGYLYQPASHIEGALVKAAARFKIAGARGKTYKDVVRAYAFIPTDEILHLYNGQPVVAPDDSLLLAPTDHLKVNIMRVVVQRAAVARARLEISAAWRLDFNIDVIEEQLSPDALHEILKEAGHAVGIGDFRPRYGRFNVASFTVQ